MAFYADWPAAMSAAQVAYTVLVEGNKGNDAMGKDNIVVGYVELRHDGRPHGHQYSSRPTTRSLCTICIASRRASRLQAGADGRLGRELSRKVRRDPVLAAEPADVEAVGACGDRLVEGVKKAPAKLSRPINQRTEHGEKIHEAFAGKGAHMFDAPVSGGPSGAASGRWRSRSAAMKLCSSNTRRCSTRWATVSPTLAGSEPRPSPSSCTTCRATRLPARFARPSRWA